MLPDRKIDRGIRSLAAAGMLLFSGCGYNATALEQMRSQPAIKATSTPVDVLPVVANKNVDPPTGSEAETVVQGIQSKYGFGIYAENWDIEEELKILSATLDKIPGAGYLVNGGIGIHKDQQFLREGGVQGIIPFYRLGPGWDSNGFNLILGNEFNQSSTKKVDQNKLHHTNQKEELEWGLAWTYGVLFSERVQSKSVSGKDQDEINLKISQDSIFSTLAKVAGWQFGPTELDIQVPVIEFKDGQTTTKIEVKKYVGWYRQTEDGRFFYDINSTFADYFATSIFYPQILPEKIRRYFEVIHEGLKNNPQEFIEEIRRNPQILLK